MDTIKLTPIVRLMMTMDHEMSLDKNGVFNEEVRKQYLLTSENADKQRDAILKTLCWVDALLAVILSGKNLKLPLVDLSLVELPACRELLTIFSSISLLFTVMFFLNAQCYSLLVDKFAFRKGEEQAIDPDFISASDKYFHFSLKLFRQKFNIFGADFYSPKKPFIILSTSINVMIAAIFIMFPVTHFCLMGFSLYQTLSIHYVGFLTIFYCSICVIINTLSVAIWLGSSTSFTFDVLQPTKEVGKSQ